MHTHTVHSVAETHQLAQSLTQQMVTSEIPATLLLSGDLGGGKTTFTQGIGQALGLTHPLPSPTYTIMRPYDIPQSDQHPFRRLIHADLYRLKAPWEAEELELPHYAHDPETILIVEWPEKAPQIWEAISHTSLTFTVPASTDQDHRIIQITTH